MSTEFEQQPFSVDANVFADNPEPRCPVILLLDTSASMQGGPITELNEGDVALICGELVPPYRLLNIFR